MVPPDKTSPARESFSRLDPILQTVHLNKIKLDPKDKEKSIQLCKKVEEKVIEKLNERSSLFNDLRKGTVYRGSYFKGVKVGTANEFDIDIKLQLPFDSKSIEITNSPNHPGFVKINVKSAFETMSKTPSWLQKYGLLKDWMDDDGYILQTKFRECLESLFSTQFPVGAFDLDLDGPLAKVVIKKGGPAFTFNVECEDLKIDIDFVFVLYFTDCWPPKPIKEFQKVPSTSEELNNRPKVRCYYCGKSNHKIRQCFKYLNSESYRDGDINRRKTLRRQAFVINKMNFSWWFAVPKPTECGQSWRLSFPQHEDYFLQRSNNLKFIYRLLKAMRDVQKWNLASYHIATLFLWESENCETSDDHKFWQQSIGNLFMYMLQKLSDCLENGRIDFFWCKDFNMIEDIKRVTLDNMRNRINEFIKQINKKYDDPTELRKYVLHNIYKVCPDSAL